METVKNQTQEVIRERLLHMLDMFGVSATVNSTLEGGTLRLDVETSNDELFTSHTADPLLALQHILRVMFKTELAQNEASLILNIGNFQNQQQSALEAVAREAVEEVVRSNAPFSMRPMSSYERRIVHMVLADHPEVSSESEGEGASRRIVVRPK